MHIIKFSFGSPSPMVQRFRQYFQDTIPKHPLEESNGIILPLFLLFLLPPVLGVCPNHEVVMFQPRTVTHLYLGSVVSCYVATPFFLTRSALLLPPSDFPLGGGVIAPDPVHSPIYFHSVSTQDHSPIRI